MVLPPAGPAAPRSGAVVFVGRQASVQFGCLSFNFRVIRTLDWATYDGWIWLDGYELNRQGEAVERRTIFVQVAGLEEARTFAVSEAGARASLRNARVPQGRRESPAKPVNKGR